MTNDQASRPYVLNVLFWTAPAVLCVFLINLITRLGTEPFSAASAKATGSALVPAAAFVFAFCITDLFQNKTAARVLYVMLSLGITWLFAF